MKKETLLSKIRALFTSNRTPREGKKPFHSLVVPLNFFLLNAAIKKIQSGKIKRGKGLFTSEILSSDNVHLSALVKQAEKACAHQDIELFSYKQFYYRNELALHRVVQWKLAKYIKTQKEAEVLIAQMRKTAPEVFKQHLVTLLKEDQVTAEEIGQEAKTLEEEWKLYQQGGGALTRISPL